MTVVTPRTKQLQDFELKKKTRYLRKWNSAVYITFIYHYSGFGIQGVDDITQVLVADASAYQVRGGPDWEMLVEADLLTSPIWLSRLKHQFIDQFIRSLLQDILRPNISNHPSYIFPSQNFLIFLSPKSTGL